MDTYSLLYKLIEDMIFGKISVINAYKMYNEYENIETDIQKSKINTIKRVILSFDTPSKTDSGWQDFFCNLRQLILVFNRKIKIPHLFKDKLSESFESTDLVVEQNNNIIYLNVIRKGIKWLGNMEDFYSVYDIDNSKRKKFENPMGDFRLKNMTGYSSYSSFAQKIIVRAIENQIDGSTILATMQTGGGKSLPGQFVSLYEEEGTTVVVVPTIALSIDQSSNSQKYFNDNRKVRTYYDGISNDEKLKIFEELRMGQVSLLYLSPESVLNGSFHDVILKSAESGIIKRLIIDEAHIVSDWGEFFRTEFQFLSIFRKKLLEVTKGKLKTILLSATITDKTEKDLKNLFSEGDNFIQIRGDSLRNEITYYKSRCMSESIREKRVLEILPFLPRPLIIYVPVIERANKFYDLLIEKGYKRIRQFTSDTSSEDRRRILDAWGDDRIDIIIATSAFGMGVDKREVRAILHTFIPENLDRFYQEVGRGGRDGYSSLSLVLTSLKEDENYITFFTRNKVLSVEKIIERWKAILDEHREQISGDELWVTVESAPERLKENGKTGKLNVSWNEYVILFLFRHKIIDILDIKLDSETKNRILNIKLIELELANDLEKLKKYLEPIRALERASVDKEIHYVRSMITNDDQCWAKYFRKTYTLTDRTCNGCPVCRRKGESKTYSNEGFDIIENKELLIKSLLANRKDMSKLVIANFHNSLDDIKKVMDLCIENEIDCVISDFNLVDKVSMYNYLKFKFYLYSYEDFLKRVDENLVIGNIAVFFSKEQDINDYLYRFILKLKNKKRIKTILMIVSDDIYIESEGKTIKNIVECSINNLGGY